MQHSPLYNDDSFCISELKRGNELAFTVLYNRYNEKLFFYCLKFVKSECLTEELVHDVWLKIWENRTQLDSQKSFNSYLHTVSKHHVFNYLKRASKLEVIKKEIIQSATIFHEESEQLLFAKEFEKLMEEAVGRLPSQRQNVFKLCKFKGFTYDETADYLGISKNAVKDHMVKAMKAIKLYLQFYTDISICWLVSFISFFF